LNDSCIGFPHPRGCPGWKSIASLEIPLGMRDEWDYYIKLVCENFIVLDRGTYDALCWSRNTKNESFTVRLGYKTWMEESLTCSKKMVAETTMEIQIPNQM
jgi:hypothetical protein